MSKIYAFHAPKYKSDHERLAINGLAYTRESSGFHDWLKRGIPKPDDPDTVFAELRSPNVPPVMWSTGGFIWISIAFLVNDDTMQLIRRQRFTGFNIAPAHIVKVSTKGKRVTHTTSREPEDQIISRKNVIDEIPDLPTLWGIRVTSLAEVRPDAGVWDVETNGIQPYTFGSQPADDLFYPSREGERYGSHLFCSGRLRSFLIKERVENIAFSTFLDWKNKVFSGA